MCNSEVVHLHVHSDYSILDGFATVDEIIDRALAIGSRAVAITDHGNLHAAAELYFKAKDKNIKPIIGCEFYYVHSDNFDNTRDNYHLLLIAYNRQGYKNLLELSRLSYEIGFYYKPRINKKLLESYRDGLICTTGCIESVVPKLFLNGYVDEAEKVFLYFLDLFGKDYYIELQYHGLLSQVKVNKYLIDLHRRYGVPLVATNDTHYAYKEHYQFHDVMLAIQTNAKIDTPGRLRFTDDSQNLSSEFYIKSAEEMMQNDIFKEYPESIKNTIEIAEKCERDTMIVFDRMLMPVLNNYVINRDNFREKVIEIAKNKLGDKYNEEVEKRLLYEISVIEKLGFVDYFIVVSYIVDIARQNNIRVGPGRGSAGGSMVAYALGITEINPMEYNLLFERFLNPDRVSPPDIDIDFEDSERDRLISILQDIFGRDNVAHIATFGRIGIRMGLRDVGRVYDVPRSKIDDIIDYYFPSKPMAFEEVLEHIKESNKKDSFDALLIQNAAKGKTFGDILDIAKSLNNRIRQVGMHASGILITPEPVHTIMPTFIVKKDKVSKKVVQFEYEYVEKMGGLKVDILGLSTLSVIKNVLNRLQNEGVYIDLSTISLKDQKVYELFSRGLTGGIFQFESEGMKSYLKELKPDSIYDLIAMNALYRPGPMEQIPTYIRRKHGQETVTYPDPRTETILKETYGIIVYQEQVMQIAQVIANYTLAEADLLRRAIGKKNKEIIEQNRNTFIERAIKNNVNEDTAKHIFHLIEQFADYGFNKSHATAYAYLAYQTAYLKTYYPEIYISEIINTYKDDRDYIKKILYECEIMNIRVIGPKLLSQKNTTSKDNTVILGLNMIKDIGDSNAEDLMSIKLVGNKSIDYANITRSINKRTREALIKAGVLDNYIQNRNLDDTPQMPTLFDTAQLSKQNKNDTLIIEHIKNEIDSITRLTSKKFRMPAVILYGQTPSILSQTRIEDFFKKYNTKNEIHTIAMLCNVTKRNNITKLTLSDDFGLYSLETTIRHIPDVLIGKHCFCTISQTQIGLRVTHIDPWNRLIKDKRFITYVDIPMYEVNESLLELFKRKIKENTKNEGNLIINIVNIDKKERDIVPILPEYLIDIDDDIAYSFRVWARFIG